MAGTGVSLIPRSSKTTKRRRTSFRPATKKSNPNKNKTASAAAKVSTSKNDASSKSAEQTGPSQVDELATSEEASKSVDSRSNIGESLVNSSEAVTENATTESKKTRSSMTRSSSVASNIVATTSATRKRKANSLNNVIRIGSSLKRKTTRTSTASASTVTEDGKKGATSSDDNGSSTVSTAIIPASKPQNSEEEQNDENPLPLESEENSIATTFRTASACFPILSAQDQATLNHLAKEGKPEGKSLLTSFCTRFKGPKRKIKDKDGGAAHKAKQNNIKRNASDGKNSKISETGATSATTNLSNDENAAPSVQIIDGEIVLQESSVMFPARRTVQEVEEEFQDNIVEEDEQLNIVQASYNSFVTKGDHGKTRNKGLWSIKETELFYLALSQLGTDFGSMEALFFEDKRTRRQLKNKYRKELIKNPDLVQELALNPKYQVALDMTAFNLEVDPKRIEAHENEEPPAYEPTDEDGIAIPTSSSNTEVTKGENNGFEGEVVEEDAEEERRAEASAIMSAENTKMKGASGDNSHWGSQNEPEVGAGFDNEMGGFPHEEGPSMDDFFHDDSYNDNDGEKEESLGKRVSEPVVTIKQDASELVSLVPKKKSSKSRRPKIRPSSKKKGK